MNDRCVAWECGERDLYLWRGHWLCMKHLMVAIKAAARERRERIFDALQPATATG